MPGDDSIHALHLATAREIFFTQQIETLESKGVNCTVCVVPGEDQIDGAMGDGRGVREYLRFLPTVRRELRCGKYDLIHANYGLTAPFALTQFKLPVLLTLWGSDVVGFDGLVTKVCAWRADAITVRSKEMRDLLGRDAHIVPSGIDLNRFRPIDKGTARERVGWPLEKKCVLFPYAPDYERKRYPLAERIVERASEQLDAEITLRTVSGVSHDQMPYYVNAADAVILTSRHEGSPNTVKEAMACNVPVVSTDVGDVRERMADVSVGGIGNSEAELIEILINVLETDRPPDGRTAVQEVSWDRIGDRFIDIYCDILAL
jgi:glycosyltransferase involved in cell wall biosynthesis